MREPGARAPLSAGRLREALELACSEALRGPRGANPVVGAVVLDAAGSVVATGHHRGAGTAHAEVDAIAAIPVGLDRSQLTLVVSLEPCSTVGRTGACTDAVRAAGIGTVAYAVADPTSAGGGAQALAAAGVRVIGPLDPAAGRALNARWFAARQADRPFVTGHLAQTLDGHAADLTGEPGNLSSDASLEHAHTIRDRVDAIIVGTGTVQADDPALTVRLPGRPERRVPVLIAGTRELDPGLRLMRRAAEVAGRDGDARDGAGHSGVVHRVRSSDPHAVLEGLRAVLPSASHVLLEGGPRLLSAFLRADLIDDLQLYVAPTVLGAGVPGWGTVPATPLASALRLVTDPAGGTTPRALGPDTQWHLMPSA